MVLKYLQQVAVLVQGNWVVNSELIYPKDSLSSQSEVSELMCKARDYIVSIESRKLFHEMQFCIYDIWNFFQVQNLYTCLSCFFQLLSFTEQQFLKRNTISSVIKLTPDEINEIFADIGTHEPNKGWRLKEPPNWDFCDRWLLNIFFKNCSVLATTKTKLSILLSFSFTDILRSLNDRRHFGMQSGNTCVRRWKRRISRRSVSGGSRIGNR